MNARISGCLPARVALGAWLCLAPTLARSEDPPPEPARPTGWAVQGLPVLNYNTDEGLGYGALVMLVDRADGTYSPYRYSLFLQFFRTTLDIASYKVVLDAPRFLEPEDPGGPHPREAR